MAAGCDGPLLPPVVVSVPTSLEQNWNFIAWNLCCACLVSVGFGLGCGVFFKQWIPITVNFASCSQLCWVWSDFGVSGISVPSSGASPFSPRGRVNHTLRCWGGFFNTNQGKITADTEIYWPVSALSTFPGASPDLPDFCPFAAVEKLSQRAAAGIFHPTHPYSGFSGWSYWNTSGPSVTELCLVPAVFKVMQSLYFSLLIIQHKFLLVMPQPLKKDLVKWHLLLKAQNIT